jgi:glycerol-3-phosphate O-acyltransferase
VTSAGIGTRIVEVGTLIRDGGAFYLRRDLGGRYQLELQRTPVDLVEKRVRIIGTLVGSDLVSADGVAPE